MSTYNGWSNRATWNVMLWINNVETMYRYWHKIARRLNDPAKLAKRLQDELTTEAHETGRFGDLSPDELAETDWNECAESLTEDVEE